MPVFKRRRPSAIRMHRGTWQALISGLAERGAGRIESGAFLLGPKGKSDLVTDLLLYDDLDPSCLTGGIDFHSIGYHRLTQHCQNTGLRVKADVHTHPGPGVGQSQTDKSHPMISREGHIAIIVPNFARGAVRPSDIGVYRYRADGQWENWRGRDAAKLVHVRRWL